MTGLQQIPGGRRGAVLVTLTARIVCTEKQAKDLASLSSRAPMHVEFDGQVATVRFERRVDGPMGGASETARREIVMLERRVQNVRIGRDAWLEVTANAEQLVWDTDSERWRRRGEAVV